ncbi:MAG: FAD-dependent monooxygenase [Promethearchaeota archaeon]
MMERNIENFDISIIGASIAGNYLSYLLSNTRLKIAVIEDHKEVGLPLQCAGVVSQKLTKLINFPQNIILNRVKVAKIVAPNGRSIKLSGNENPYIIDRVALDRFFYEEIRNRSNIQHFFGERFKSFKYVKEEKNRCLLIETSKRTIKTKILIGCDGPLSTVASSLGIKRKVLYAMQIRISGKFKENEAVMYFNSKWKELFGWIVPEGNQIFRIGLACSHNIKRNFHYFLTQLSIDFDQKIDQQGGLIPYEITNKIAFNNIMLLGDSACQVKTTTGGGIIMLLTSAKYAAVCIKECFNKNNFSKKLINKNYGRSCHSSIGKELKIHYLIRAILEKLEPKDFMNLFIIMKSSNSKNIINLYGDMDFPKSFIFKFLKNPRFITFFIKFILKNPIIFVSLLKVVF